MIIQKEHHEVVSNIDTEASQFSINVVDSTIFDILRSKMYSDAFQSMIRELLDNARDSHRAAGKRDIPIDVWNGEYFTVRDYGLGIPPDKMTEIYCVYGNSTKRETNDLGGGFGLGSKTPFAVSDSFQVTSIWNGKRYQYSVFIDESGIGKIQLVKESTTDECNGLEVKVPIKTNMSYRIPDIVQTLTKYWFTSNDAMPRAHGFSLKPIKDYLIGDNFIYYNDYYCDVIINGLPYKYETYSDSAVKIIAKTGEFKMSANRETIQQSQEMTDLFEKKSKIAEKEFGVVVSKDLEKLPSFKDACLYLNKLPSGTYLWQNKEFEYPIQKYKYSKYSGVTKESFRINAETTVLHEATEEQLDDEDLIKRQRNKIIVAEGTVLDSSIQIKPLSTKRVAKKKEIRAEDLLWHYDVNNNRKRLDITAVQDTIYWTDYYGFTDDDKQFADDNNLKVIKLKASQMLKVDDNKLFKHLPSYIREQFQNIPEKLRVVNQLDESFQKEFFDKPTIEELNKYKKYEKYKYQIPNPTKRLKIFDAVNLYYIKSLSKKSQDMIKEVIREEIKNV